MFLMRIRVNGAGSLRSVVVARLTRGPRNDQAMTCTHVTVVSRSFPVLPVIMPGKMPAVVPSIVC